MEQHSTTIADPTDFSVLKDTEELGNVAFTKPKSEFLLSLKDKWWIGIIVAVAVAFLTGIGSSLFSLNREVGELSSQQKAQEKTNQNLSDEIGKAENRLRDTIKELSKRLNRIEDRFHSEK